MHGGGGDGATASVLDISPLEYDDPSTTGIDGFQREVIRKSNDRNYSNQWYWDHR
jgi:hypothetical protein